MTSTRRISCVLWDFGDTLADQTFAWAGPTGVEGWRAAWERLYENDLANRWDRGEVGVDAVVAFLGGQIERDVAWVLAELKALCDTVALFPSPMDVVRRRRLPQAMVTVNPDAFRRWVVPPCGFDEHFDTIVISCEHGTLDKVELCDIALDRLGIDDPGAALLIDNLVENVEGWRAHGGLAYQFVDDDQFRRDLEHEPLSQLPS